MLPVSSEDIDLDPQEGLLSATLRSVALGALAICAIVQLVSFLAG